MDSDMIARLEREARHAGISFDRLQVHVRAKYGASLGALDTATGHEIGLWIEQKARARGVRADGRRWYILRTSLASIDDEETRPAGFPPFMAALNDAEIDAWSQGMRDAGFDVRASEFPDGTVAYVTATRDDGETLGLRLANPAEIPTMA
jgi:hypothetical protein